MCQIPLNFGRKGIRKISWMSSAKQLSTGCPNLKVERFKTREAMLVLAVIVMGWHFSGPPKWQSQGPVRRVTVERLDSGPCWDWRAQSV